MKKLLKQKKLNQFKQIQQKYKYIYIYRYSDLKISELMQLKKILQKLNFNAFFLKKKLLNNKISNLEGQGSVLLLYSNINNFNMLKILKTVSKIEFLFFKHKNYLYSKIKLTTILKKNFF